MDNHYPLADKMAASHFTPMEHLIWSPSEKRLARKLFDNALQRELADLVMDFRKRAEAVQTPDEMWKLRRFLEQAEREVEEKYDYRTRNCSSYLDALSAKAGSASVNFRNSVPRN